MVNVFQVEKYRPRVETVEHRFFLVGEIGEAEDYLDLFEALADAREEETVHIHINTVGGNLSTVAQILHHIQRTKAGVVTHAEGQVASGGSLIFFSGHSLDVGDFSEFLAHGPHGLDGGKLQDRLDGGKHLKAYVKSLYQKAYEPFYSKREIENILRGKEHYETAEQVIARLQRAVEKLGADVGKD